MKKFINTVEDFCNDSIEGFASAYSDIVTLHRKPKFISRNPPSTKPKVSIISGGGSGHEPLHCGFVGYGMLDAACPGNVFTSPTPDQILAAAEFTHSEMGSLFIVKNYSGDVMNFEMASELFPGKHKTIIVADDIATASTAGEVSRRGMAGTIVVEKIVGAAAEDGRDLDFCYNLAVKVCEQTRSIGVALTSCTVPAMGRPTFSLGKDQMEIGIGIHGEPGVSRRPIEDADVIAHQMVTSLANALDNGTHQRLLVIVNGFGATPEMELTLMYNSCLKALSKYNYTVEKSLIGNFVTSLDMAGCSLTFCVIDDEILQFWDAPVNTARLRWRM